MATPRALRLPWACWLSITPLTACSEGNAETLPHPGVGACAAARRVVFLDAETGFSSARVHDADREVVCVDPTLSTMVSDDGTTVAEWTASNNDLTWARSSVAFRVRFGSEQGERRAYFTETATGTICDLDIPSPDQLRIFATSELPPEP